MPRPVIFDLHMDPERRMVFPYQLLVTPLIKALICLASIFRIYIS